MKENAAAEAIRIRQEATEAAEAVVRDKIADKVKAVADAQAKIAEAEGKRNAKGDNKRSLRHGRWRKKVGKSGIM
jgi:hypothetical protein